MDILWPGCVQTMVSTCFMVMCWVTIYGYFDVKLSLAMGMHYAKDANICKERHKRKCQGNRLML